MKHKRVLATRYVPDTFTIYVSAGCVRFVRFFRVSLRRYTKRAERPTRKTRVSSKGDAANAVADPAYLRSPGMRLYVLTDTARIL